MAKSWNQLTDSEKIEELRRDLMKTMSAVNQLTAHSDLVDRTIGDLAGRVRDLERQAEEKESKMREEHQRGAKSKATKGNR